MYIYQIEVSNVCSLRCSYCPHPKQVRPKGMMSFDTFKKCVELFKVSGNRSTLRLHNFGEALLHPELPKFLSYAAGEGVECSFFTNGVSTKGQAFSREFWQNLANHGLKTVDFSAHALSVDTFSEMTNGLIKIGRVFDPKTRTLGTWAGQTGPPETPVPEPCLFERMNAMVILWDGRVSSCCLDVEGKRSPLWIDDLLRTKRYEFEPIHLCSSCSSMRHEEDL
jgi:Radical SAM superfamily